jgi:hypothetical protein
MQGKHDNSHLAEFQTPINLYSDLILVAAFSTGLLKSCKYLYILTTYIKTFASFYSEQLPSLNRAILLFHFRVAEFPFISRIRVGFETQLMDTTKCSRTVSKMDSHSTKTSRVMVTKQIENGAEVTRP